MYRQVLHPQKVRLRPKVRGHLQLRGNVKAGREEIRNPTQRRVLKCGCKMHTLAGRWTQQQEKLVATEEESGDVDLSESETWSFQEEAVALKPCASSKSDCQRGPKAERKVWPHHLQTDPDTAHHTEAVFSIVMEIYGREHEDPMEDLDVNMATWGIFLNVTLRAAVHLGQDNEAKLRYILNHLWSSVKQLFNETGKTDQWSNRNHWCKHD